LEERKVIDVLRSELDSQMKEMKQLEYRCSALEEINTSQQD
jgi:hypothetical protein